jgi:hypothetical protein
LLRKLRPKREQCRDFKNFKVCEQNYQNFVNDQCSDSEEVPRKKKKLSKATQKQNFTTTESTTTVLSTTTILST